VSLRRGDRVLFAISQNLHSVRSLVRELEVDQGVLYKVLGRLEDLGLIQRSDDKGGAVFYLAEGVDVEYRPGRLRVSDADGRDPRTDGAGEGRCTATTSHGTRCKLDATDEGLCMVHTP
jgi:hypothetical protein